MSIEPFKYLIQPIALERDENGKIVREIPGETIAVYSAEKAVEAITEFEAQLARFNVEDEAKSNGKSELPTEILDSVRG